MLFHTKLNAILKLGVVSMAIKLGSMFIAFSLSILLARGLGAEGYGVYSYVYAIVTILAIPTQSGLPTLIVREVSKYDHKQQWGNLKGVLWWSSKITLFASFFMMSFVIAYIIFFYDTDIQSLKHTIYWGVLLIPLVALGNVRGAALRGLQNIVLGQLPETVIRPGLLLLFVLLFFYFDNLAPSKVMALHVFSSSVAFVVGMVLLTRNLPVRVRSSSAVFENKTWVNSLIPLSILSGVHVVNSQAGLIIIGIFSDKESVGIFKIAILGSSIVSLTMYAVAMVVAPQFSRLYSGNKIKELQDVVICCSRISFFVSFPIVLFMLVFGKELLSFLFGDAFVVGYNSLVILCIAQLINSSFGAIGTLLNMSGYERLTLTGVAFATGCNLLFTIILVPLYGIEGGAVATLMSFTLWNSLLWHFARHKIGVESFALFPKKRV